MRTIGNKRGIEKVLSDFVFALQNHPVEEYYL